MNVNQLHAKAARLERELKETRDQLARATHDAEDFTAELERERAYAFSGSKEPVEVTIEGCADSLSRFGFCVVDNVIPENEVDAIRDEVVSAQAISARNIQAIEDLSEERGLEGQALLEAGRENGLELRPVRGVGLAPKPPNDIIWMPRYGDIWPIPSSRRSPAASLTITCVSRNCTPGSSHQKIPLARVADSGWSSLTGGPTPAGGTQTGPMTWWATEETTPKRTRGASALPSRT